MKTSGVIWKSIMDFFRDDGFILAGSLSFSMMMAIFPFCLFLITSFGYFLGHYPEFYRFFLSRMISLFPQVTGEVNSEILKLVSYKGLGKFSIVLFALMSYQAFSSVEYSLNIIFRVSKKRKIFYSILVSMIVITFIMILITASFLAASLVPILKSIRHIPMFFKMSKFTGFIIQFVLPFLVMLFAITAIYELLPKTRVKLSSAFKGALFTTVFMEGAKYVFTWYVVLTISDLGKIYGPLTAFVLFLLWIFYSCCIFLIGAELVHNLGTVKRRI